MEIQKHIHNQTFHTIRINNRMLRPGESMSTVDDPVNIYQTKTTYLSFLDRMLCSYTSDEFTIYITDQHGLIKQANFADATLFLSIDNGNSCLYESRNDVPIINPAIYLYNKIPDKSYQDKNHTSWISRLLNKLSLKN